MPAVRSRKSRTPPSSTPEIVIDPVASAKSAGLRYVTDARPGIQRVRRGKGFRYVGADGKPVRDAETLARIKSLVIPPAWQQVWISAVANGHLQATGRDVKGRKQSRYHPRWREVRDETKFERMTLFADALPAIRARVEHDLARPGLPREKVLATLVRLMETTFIRVGNEEYARTNQSYGLTTMRNKHVTVHGSTITFDFQGKSGVEHTIDLEDRRLAAIIKRCRDLPGYELFQYLDSDGVRHTIDASNVNEYLHQITAALSPEMEQAHFTAKDFRTWAGTVLACEMLRGFEPFTSDTQAKKNVVEAIKSVAARLGNTPSVCRKCYVHPAVLEHYFGGSMMAAVKLEVAEAVVKEVDRKLQTLREEEHAVLELLARKAA